MKRRIVLWSFMLTLLFPLCAQVDISLAGRWKYRVDSLSVGERDHWATQPFTRSMQLPGSTSDAGIGNTLPLHQSILGCARFADYPANADFGSFTPRHKYVGKMWYQRTFKIGKKQAGDYSLFLERVMWRSRVWIDGKEVDAPIDYLTSPHTHYLGYLSPGEHSITLMVDNSEIQPVGLLGHNYCPQMQTLWNGVIGKMGLQRQMPLRISDLSVYPSYAKEEVTIRVQVGNRQQVKSPSSLTLVVREKKGKTVCKHTIALDALTDGSVVSHTFPLANPQPWDEFTPNLYEVEALLSSGLGQDEAQATFGFRDLGTKDKHFTINGRKMIYRNSHEGMFFARTGYPEMSVSYWRKIWKVYKAHGFNAVRFHSSCPPEAAFIAADELGLYLQVEFFWKDGWMGGGSLLGAENETFNQFAFDEVRAALRSYGNHPSMMLVSFGNELGGNFDWMGERIRDLKQADPRHMYAAGIAHNITPYDEFVEYGGKGKALGNAGTDWDYAQDYLTPSAHAYDAAYLRKDLPEFTHETGQYIVHPLWSEIHYYNGAIAPLNLKYYKSLAEANGLASMDAELQRASGQVNRNLYKAEIEATLRTPQSAGYGLLSMVDYPGQGEALVGWVNPLYHNKNFITPEEFACYGTHTVPLLRFGKYVWEDGDTFTGKVEVANYGNASIEDKPLRYTLTEGDSLLATGVMPVVRLPQGELTRVGSFSFPLHAAAKGSKVDIHLAIEGTPYHNSWSVWVFPKAQPDLQLGDSILLTHSVDEALVALDEGKRVLLMADKAGSRKGGMYATFNPVFWSATWFTGQNTDVSGAYVRHQHPALAQFLTADVIDWQWEDICRGARGFVLNEYPDNYYPIVQPVNDFHHGNKLGTLFEFTGGKGGKLLVCGYNLTEDMDVRPAARQLRRSLLAYLQSDAFQPQQPVSEKWLRLHLKDFSQLKVNEMNQMNALFYVSPMETDYGGIAYTSKQLDQVLANEDDFDYTLHCDGIWQDDKGTYWYGQNLTLEIDVKHANLMNLRLCFYDSNRSHRSARIKCEDLPEIQLDKHEVETWVTIPISRENCLDGKIKVEMKCTGGPNLMMTKVALVPQQ